MSAGRGRKLTLVAEDGTRHELERVADGATVADQFITVAPLGGGHYRAGQRMLSASDLGGERWVFVDGRTYVFRVERQGQRPRSGVVDHAGHAAPMPATVTRIDVAAGDRVRAGDIIVTLEAMKMELPIRAAIDGIVKALGCRVGELVQPGEPLVDIEETS
ncbi:MAG TPA: biotin/lipoyl-containing protein [Vicinamibacterales bacterium]|nr:biotin/lipoyl-containing protein [Vicinamibacterales bacterium]